MKKRISYLHLLIFAAIILMCSSSFPQSSGYRDRLSQVKDLVNSNELIMIWSQGVNSNNQF